jgi:hypothetical protein
MSRFSFYRVGVVFLLCWGCRDGAPKKSAPTETTPSGSAAPADAASDLATPTPGSGSDVPAPGSGSAVATSVPPASDEDAAKLIFAAFDDPAKADSIASLIPAGRTVKVTARGGGSGKKSFEGVAGLSDLAAGNATAMKIGACTKGCCELKPEFDDDRKLGAQLRKVCFDDKRTLTSVEIAYEN